MESARLLDYTIVATQLKLQRKLKPEEIKAIEVVYEIAFKDGVNYAKNNG